MLLEILASLVKKQKTKNLQLLGHNRSFVLVVAMPIPEMVIGGGKSWKVLKNHKGANKIMSKNRYYEFYTVLID